MGMGQILALVIVVVVVIGIAKLVRIVPQGYRVDGGDLRQVHAHADARGCIS